MEEGGLRNAVEIVQHIPQSQHQKREHREPIRIFKERVQDVVPIDESSQQKFTAIAIILSGNVHILACVALFDRSAARQLIQS